MRAAARVRGSVRVRGSMVAAVVAAVLLLAPARAGAHAALRSSEPAGGARLPSAPAVVSLTFTEAPEIQLSVVRVLDATGVQYAAGSPATSTGDRLTLRQRVRSSIPDGVYTVAWRVVSRVDGHVTSGAFAFGVGTTTTPVEVNEDVTSVAAPPISPFEVAGRWLFFLGVAGLLGGALIGGTLGGTVTLRFSWIAWASGVTGALVLALAQRAATGASLGDFLNTTLGDVAELRFGLMAFSAGSLLEMRRKPRTGALITGASAAGAALLHVWGGHAAAASVPPIAIAVQWLHIVLAGLWLGGLAALLVAIRGEVTPQTHALVRRFSAVAAIFIGVVALTGVLRALDELGGWSALTGSGYGRAVLGKSALLLVLAAFGGMNRYRSVPAATTSTAMLRRLARGELAFAAVTFAVAALLASISPPQPAKAVATQPSALRLSGSDFATSVRVELEAKPGRPGPNAFAVRVLDYDTRAPVDGTVSLRFSFLDDPSVGASTLALTRAPDGLYKADGANLSLQGRWRIVVLIERGVRTVEVPLEATVTAGPQKVRVDRLPGQPTLYTVELAGGGTVQVYADPEKPGRSDMHVTFFDAKGNERPVESLSVDVRAPGGTVSKSAPRRFTPGHFAVEVTFEQGTSRVTISAAMRDGARVAAELDLAIA